MHIRRALQILVTLLWPVTNLFAQPDAQSSSSTSIFSPASTPADTIFGFSLFVFAITGVIFLIVGSLLVYAAVIGFTPIILATIASRFFKPELLRPVPTQ